MKDDLDPDGIPWSPAMLHDIQSVAGTLMDVVRQTRPDAMWLVHRVQHATAMPTATMAVRLLHEAVDRMQADMRPYVIDTTGWNPERIRIVTFSDASFAKSRMERSQTGYITGLAEEAIHDVDCRVVALSWASRMVCHGASPLFPEAISALKATSNAMAIRDLCAATLFYEVPIDTYLDCADLFFSAYSSHTVEDQSLWTGIGVLRDRLKTAQLRHLIHINDTSMVADPLTKEVSSARQLANLRSFMFGFMTFDKSTRHSYGRALRGDGAEVHCCGCWKCKSLGPFDADGVFDNVCYF
jgi:hypothetical protein